MLHWAGLNPSRSQRVLSRLTIDLARMPALPASGFRIEVAAPVR